MHSSARSVWLVHGIYGPVFNGHIHEYFLATPILLEIINTRSVIPHRTVMCEAVTFHAEYPSHGTLTRAFPVSGETSSRNQSNNDIIGGGSVHQGRGY